MPLEDIKQQKTMYDRVLETYRYEGKDPQEMNREWFRLQPKLVICGGGHVSVQVLKIAKMLDFYVQVIDDRKEFANAEHLPEADKICCHDFLNIADILPQEDNIYYVVVTRGHAADRVCVEQILKRPYAYLGMIGSKLKVAKTMETLLAKGYTKEQVDSIHSPIGISIKAQTPAEIAVSILAEIIEVKNSSGITTMTKELYETEERGVLCVITSKSGSSPRSVGSMMLVRNDGSMIGSIGGGAVEYEAVSRAKTVTQICVENYDLSNSESAKLGMICGGTNQVTFIPILC